MVQAIGSLVQLVNRILNSGEIDDRDTRLWFVVENPVCVLLSCDQESKRAPAGATKSRSAAAGADALDPSTALRAGSRTIEQDEGIEMRAVRPSTHFVGGQKRSPGERRYVFSRGPDQHPLGGDTAALPVAAPAQKHTGAGSSPGLYRVGNGQRIMATKPL